MRKDIDMKKLLAHATAASVVAFAAGANAVDTWTLNLKGNVPNSLVVTESASCSGDCTEGTSGSTTNITLTNFSDGTETGHVAGSKAFTMNANLASTAKLFATGGQLVNGALGVDYGISLTSAADAALVTSKASSHKTEATAKTTSVAANDTTTVTVYFDVAATQTANIGGDYTDTLTLKIVAGS
jgi:hypothetical protein